MESPEHQERAIREYMASQCEDERVVHLEKVSSECVQDTKYDVWDVHTDKGRWWVITNPPNPYIQTYFPGMHAHLTFKIVLALRASAQHDQAGSDDDCVRFLQTLRRQNNTAKLC